MGQNGDVRQDEALKLRMEQRLYDVRKTMRELADETGTPYKQVRRWIKEDTRVPADFLAAFVSAVAVNPRWLLTGEGSPDTPAESTESAYRAGVHEAVGQMEDVLREMRARYRQSGDGS
jgi:hypothetical protein